MIKEYCDICETEISPENAMGPNLRISGELGKTATVELRVKSTAQACKYCALSAIAALDKRPQPAAKAEKAKVL